VPTHLDNTVRDELITAFRTRICHACSIIPLRHQADWWAATDGSVLLEVGSADGTLVRLPDNSTSRLALAPRPGGRARVVADLGAFKVGKSFGAGVWAAAFACIPNARVQLIGLEYDICSPEFEYIVETLLSGNGLGLKYESLQNRPRDGRMWLDFPNGARFEARSWERKDTLKGKEIDAYIYCEAYMLPGLECYTGFSQNLRARSGYAVFATTPDRPWVNELHTNSHSGDPRFADWHCTCGIPASANASTFDARAMDRDRGLMTNEKFEIHYLGKMGVFARTVYGFQRGQRVFTPQSHPFLFTDDHLTIPDGWDIVGGADTGTYTSAVLVAFSPEGDAFVLEEFPNYAYIAGVPELDESASIPSWSAGVALCLTHHGARGAFWADKNSQFKRELRRYGIHLSANNTPFEARTEITREYFTHNRVWLASHLKVLPFELENAKWPETASSAGRFTRVKDRDHTLDSLEHVLSKRPQGTWAQLNLEPKRWIDGFVQGVKVAGPGPSPNPHLGRN
jgi:hypothetical protein